MRLLVASAPVVCACALALSYAAPSRAETIDAATRATARQLGEEGMQAYDKGDCATAADKLTRAHDLVHVPTLAYYAGRCLEKLGRLAEAEEKYVDAMRDPLDAGASATVKGAQLDADKARKALIPRIPSVVLNLQPPMPDAQVLLDGKPVPPAMLGVKRFVDPGQHTVQVIRLGGMLTKRFTVQEAESTNLDLEVPAPVQGPPPVGGPPTYPYPYSTYPYGPRRPVYATYPPPPPTRRANVGLMVGGCILAPVGAIVSLVGVVFLIAPSDTLSGGSSNNTVTGGVLVGVGLAGLGGGIAMAVIGGKKVPLEAPPAPAPAPAVSFEPLLGPTSVGMRMRF
jgi:hypothetical protein